MYLVFTRMPGESYRRWLRSLLLYLCYVFRALINSLVYWFFTSALGLILFQIFDATLCLYYPSLKRNLFRDTINYSVRCNEAHPATIGERQLPLHRIHLSVALLKAAVRTIFKLCCNIRGAGKRPHFRGWVWVFNCTDSLDPLHRFSLYPILPSLFQRQAVFIFTTTSYEPLVQRSAFSVSSRYN